MIGHALRLHIERSALQARTTNPLLVRAELGSLGAEHLTHYLRGLHALLHSTPIHMALARAAALAAEDLPLAAHLAHKASEEEGHDAWAAADLQTVSSGRASVADGVPASMRGFIAWITSTIEEDPRLYLGYMLFAEYVTVLLAPEWLDLLEARCRIPRSAMTAIDKHVQLDRDHVEEAIDVIDALVADPTRLGRMRAIVGEAFVRYEAFCTEIVALGDRDLEESARHAPAA